MQTIKSIGIVGLLVGVLMGASIQMQAYTKEEVLGKVPAAFKGTVDQVSAQTDANIDALATLIKAWEAPDADKKIVAASKPMLLNRVPAVQKIMHEEPAKKKSGNEDFTIEEGLALIKQAKTEAEIKQLSDRVLVKAPRLLEQIALRGKIADAAAEARKNMKKSGSEKESDASSKGSDSLEAKIQAGLKLLEQARTEQEIKARSKTVMALEKDLAKGLVLTQRVKQAQEIARKSMKKSDSDSEQPKKPKPESGLDTAELRTLLEAVEQASNKKELKKASDAALAHFNKIRYTDVNAQFADRARLKAAQEKARSNPDFKAAQEASEAAVKQYEEDAKKLTDKLVAARRQIIPGTKNQFNTDAMRVITGDIDALRDKIDGDAVLDDIQKRS